MKNRFPREFYIPKGSIKVADKASSAVAYVYESAGRVCAVGFRGKADKPTFRYSYRTPARRELAIQEFFQSVQRADASRAEQAASRKGFVHDYKAGEVLYTSWGYDQTNVEFFEITEVKGKHVILREIASEYEERGFMSGRTVPQPGKYISEPIRRLGQKGRIKIDDVRTAWRLEFKEVAGVKVYESRSTSSYA